MRRSDFALKRPTGLAQGLRPDFNERRRGGILSFERSKMSPGWHLKARQIFSSVSKLIPTAFPFFSRHKVV